MSLFTCKCRTDKNTNNFRSNFWQFLASSSQNIGVIGWFHVCLKYRPFFNASIELEYKHQHSRCARLGETSIMTSSFYSNRNISQVTCKDVTHGNIRIYVLSDRIRKKLTCSGSGWWKCNGKSLNRRLSDFSLAF